MPYDALANRQANARANILGLGVQALKDER
jgi:hypothetical protein